MVEIAYKIAWSHVDLSNEKWPECIDPDMKKKKGLWMCINTAARSDAGLSNVYCIFWKNCLDWET